jgi:hypothetical protein
MIPHSQGILNVEQKFDDRTIGFENKMHNAHYTFWTKDEIVHFGISGIQMD